MGKVLRVLVGAALALATACNDGSTREDNVGALQQPLSTNDRILGFESVATDWTTNSGSISASANHVEGEFGLAAANTGSAVFESSPLSSLGEVGENLTLDLFYPTPPNPSWYGTLKVVLVAPSLGMYWQELGEKNLQGTATNEFVRHSFTLPPDVRDKLEGVYSDLRVRIVLNVPSAAGPWVLDRVSFGNGAPPLPGSVEFFVKVPSHTTRESLALASFSGPLDIHDGVKVLGANGGFASVGTIATESTQIGVEAEVQNISSQAPVTLRNRANVHGFLKSLGTVTKAPDAVVDGSTVSGSVLPAKEYSWTVTFPSNNQGALDVPSDSQWPTSGEPLAPGAYGTVSVKPRARLLLTGGADPYYFDSLSVEAQATLEIDNQTGPVVINVRRGFIFRGEIERSDDSKGNVLFAVAGSEGAHIESAFQGGIVAPYGPIDLASSAEGHRGSFLGASVIAHQWTTITHEPILDEGAACEPGACNAFCPCGPPPASRLGELRVLLPKGVSPARVALGAAESLVLGNNNTVSGAETTFVTSALGTVSVGAQGALEAIAAKGDVTLGAGTAAQGDVSSEGTVSLEAGASVGGQTTEGADLSPPQVIGWNVIVPRTRKADVLVRDGREKILFPDGYGKLKVEAGSKLFLRSGTYFFETLEVASGAELVLESSGGLVEIYVDSTLAFSGVVSGLGGNKPHLLVAYLGNTSASVGGEFRGVIVAPEAELIVGQGQVTGALFAKAITVGDGASIEQEPAPWDDVTGETPDGTPTETVELGESPVVLEARNEHKPDESTSDGTSNPAQPALFKIPAKLNVNEGNAGNWPAVLSFTDGGGNFVECTYRGGASSGSPTDLLEIAKGREYLFESCSNGLVAGDETAGTNFRLSIQGDPQGVGDGTGVHLTLGPGCDGILEQPISPAESVAMVQGFSWAQTQALPELTPEGYPTLFYANIYIRNATELALLDTFRIHWEKRPIFDNELQAYAGRCGTFRYEGDGEGIFVFAVIPGKTYNRIRAAFTHNDIPPEQRELFKAIILRQAPAAATNPDGSLSYQVLMDAGFQYLGVRDLPSDQALDETELPSGGAVAKLVDAVEFVAEVANDVAQTVTVVIGAIDRFLQGSVNVTVQVDVYNRDPRFAGLLTRGWGPARGGLSVDPTPIRIHGAKVEILQWAQRVYTLGAPLPTKFTGRTNQYGRVSIDVAKGGDGFGGATSPRGASGLCIELENKAAKLTSFLIADDVCDIPVIDVNNPTSANSPYGNFEHDSEVAISTKNPDLVALSEITDGYDYYSAIIGGNYVKPRALRGFNASVLSAGNTGLWVPCFGRRNAVVDTAVLVALSVPVVGTAAAGYLAILGTSDMVIPDGSAVERLRGVMTHEFGHYAFCNLLGEAPGATEPEYSFYTNLTIETMVTGINGVDPGDHARIINEAFADFYAGQVVGGSNYFILPGVDSESDFTFCANIGTCWDSNVASNETPAKLIMERLATTTHDAFDGHCETTPSPGETPCKRRLTPNDGDFWKFAPSTTDQLVYMLESYGDAKDETVAMAGPRFQDIANALVERVNRSVSLDLIDFEGALADAISYDHNWCQGCQLFALHEYPEPFPLTVQDTWLACLTDSKLFDIMGPAPDGTLRMDATECKTCPERSYSDQTGTCIECADREVRVDNGCVACEPGFIQIDNACVECPNGFISAANTCVACPVGQTSDRPTNTCVDCPSDIVIDAGHIQSTGEPVTVLQSTTTPPGDLCPDELWISLINVDSDGESLVVAVDLEDELSGLACTASSLLATVFELSGSGWAPGQSHFETGKNCLNPDTGDVCVGGLCYYNPLGDSASSFIIDPDSLDGASTARLRIRGNGGGTPEPAAVSVGTPIDPPPPPK